jgi:hypothetical protein
VEIKKSGILRNGPESVILERKHWEEVKTQAKASIAYRERSERFEKENNRLWERNESLGNELKETRRENRKLRSLLEKKDQLIKNLKQAAKELYKNGESVFHQLMGYVKGRFMLHQEPTPEEQKGFEQGEARTNRELAEREKEYQEVKKSQEQHRGYGPSL